MMDVKINRRSDDTTFGTETFSWQDPIHSWKAGPGEVMTVEVVNPHCLCHHVYMQYGQSA